jgi:excisionase family DNA binding protein
MDDVLLLSIADVSKMLNVSDRTVRNLLQKGDLSSLRIGRCIRIEKQSVCHFIEERRAYNNDCAGLAMRDPQGERKCLNSAKIEKVSSDVPAQSTGGLLSPTQAVKEFNALLGQPARAKH